jgi:hypothetical protein
MCDDDGGDARLRVVFLLVVGVAAGGHDLQRLQRRTVHQHIGGRPVGAGDGQLVLVALELGGVDGAASEPVRMVATVAAFPSTGRSG